MRCLIIDDIHPCFIETLQKNGIETDYRPEITAQEAKDLLGSYEGLMVRSKMKITEDDLLKASKLQFIARAGAGVDHIDKEAVSRRGIALLSAAEGNMDAVGEHAVGMLLALLNHLVSGTKEVREFLWKREENRGLELGEMTVGIIGYGNMGQAFAKRLSSFGCEVLVYDKYKTDYSNEWGTETPLDEMLEKIDVLSFHVPLTDETNYYYDHAFQRRIYKDIWLINTARGPVVNLDTVIAGVESGKLKGVALDVLENEKFDKLSEQEKRKYEVLFSKDQVILSPHVAGWSVASYRKIAEVLARKVVAQCTH